MALSTRELLLVLRVSDRTGGALRRVSRDIGGLTSRQNLQLAQRQQQIQIQRANTARRIAAQNLLSARSGSQALRIDTQRLAVEKGRTLNQFKQAGLGLQASRNVEAQLTNYARLSKLQRDIATAQVSPTGMVGGRSLAELKTMQDVAISRAQTLTREEQLLAEKAGVAAGSLNGLALQEQRLAASTAEASARQAVLKERFRTTSDAARLQAARLVEIKRAESQLRWDRLERGARLMEHFGRVLAIGGTIGTLALGGAARQAATFQTQLALAATQARKVGAPASQTLEIQQRLMGVVLKQMRQFPAASQEMADSLYQVFSGTNIQQIDQASGALRLFNQMAVAGGTDLATMTQAGISLINNFDNGRYSIQSLTKEANLFFAAVRYGRMNAQQFADSFGSIIPFAKAAGENFRDVADAMAFLTRQSGATARNVSRDATGLSRLFELFSRPEVMKGLQRYGVQVEDAVTGKMRPLLEIMTQISERIKLRPGPETLNFFKQISALGGQGAGSRGLAGTIQSRRVFAFMLNDIKEYRNVARLVNRDTDEFQKSYAALAQTPGVRWQVFTNQLKALAITIGTAVIPVFGELGDYVQKAVDWFNRLSPHTQRTIAQMALFASVGALVGGVLIMIVGGLASLVLTARIALRGFGLLGAEAGAINARFAIFIGTAGALIYLLIKYPGIFHQMTDAVGGLKNAILLLGLVMVGLKFSGIINGILGIGAAAGITGAKLTILEGIARRLPAIAVALAAYEAITQRQTDAAIGRKGAVAIIGKTLMGRKVGDKAFWDPALNSMVRLQEINGHVYAVPVGGRPPGTIQTPTSDPTGRRMAQQRRREYQIAQEHNRRINREAAVAAVQTGFPTANIQKLEANVLRAREVLRGLDPIKDFKKYYDAELKLNNAQAELQANVSREQYNAYNKSVNARMSAEDKLHGHVATISKATFFAELKQLIALRNAYLRSHNPGDAEKYYDARRKLTKESSDSERRYITDAVSRTDAAYKKQLAAQKAAVKAQNQMYADALSNLTQMYNQFFGEQQQNYGNLFQGPVMTGQKMQVMRQWGEHASPADLLKDIRAQNFQYNRFNRLVGSLSERGAPRELVDQIRAAGPAAMQDVYALTKMTPQQWKQYVAAFKSGQEAIKRNTMAQLNSQIAMYKQHGKNVAKAVVAGITSEDARLQKALDNMLRRALGIKPTADYKPGPHKTNVLHDNRTVIHVTGDPGDHKTRSSIRHGLWRTRVHTSGGF